MHLSKKYIVQIIVALIGLVGMVLGGSSIMSTINVRTAIANDSSTTIVVNDSDTALDIVQKLMTQNEDLQSQLQSAQAQVEELQGKLQEKPTSGVDEGEYNALQDRYDELNTSYNSLEKSNQTLQKDYDELSSSYDELKKERDALQEHLDSLANPLNTVPEGGTLLADLEVFNGNSRYWSVNSGEKADTLGHDYSGSSSYIVAGRKSGGRGSAEYFIDGIYSNLTGIIAPHSTAHGEYKSKIQVYGDEKLLYESPEVGIRTDVFSFEIRSDKLSGVRFLKIVQEGDSRIPLLLTDWTLN